MLSSSSILWSNLGLNCRKVILNRPKAMNSLNIEMCNEIKILLNNWINDSSIIAILMRGEGEKAFCAGILLYFFSSFSSLFLLFFSFLLFSRW